MNEKGVRMKLFYMLVVIIFWSSSLAWSKPFPGHVHYEVKYSKNYSSEKLPREYESDFYLSNNKKAIVTTAGLQGNDKQVFMYIFDDEKKIMSLLNMKDKTYSLINYDKLPILNVSEYKPQTPAKAMEILGEKLYPTYFKNDQTNLTYSIWYST